MKRENIVASIWFFLLAFQLQAQKSYETINKTTYGLDRSQSCLKDPSCLRGAATVGAQAVVAATAHAEEASTEVKKTEKKISDHVEDVSKLITDAQRVATQWANFYTDKVGPHNEDAAKQRAANQAAVDAINAFNGLPEEQKSAGEADRLNKELQATLDWGERVNNRRDNLINEMTPILEEKDALDQKRQELMEENRRLQNELQMKKFEEGEAYRQLKRCAEYAAELNVFIGKNKSNGIDLIELNSADETIKNLSNKMFGEGNNHTGSVLAGPGFVVVPNNGYSNESYQTRAQRLIDALPPGQRSIAVAAAITGPGSNKSAKAEVPSPSTNKSSSPGIIDRFMNWIKKQ
jgi:hypothetical protein